MSASIFLENVGGMKLKFGEEIEQHLIDHNGRQLGEIFSILAIIPACRGGSCGWRPSSCKHGLPFFVSFCCFVHFLTLLFVSLLLTWLYFSVIEVKRKEVVTASSERYSCKTLEAFRTNDIVSEKKGKFTP